MITKRLFEYHGPERLPLGSIYHAYSQILLQQHKLCGALLILAIACHDLLQLACSLLGILGAHLWPKGSALNRAQGLQGYNGAVLGLALPALGVIPAVALPASLAGGFLCAGLLGMFSPRLPPLTAPFVLVMLWLGPVLQWSHAVEPLAPASLPGLESGFTAPLWGVGQILFLSSPLAVTLAVLALFLASPTGALFALAGSLAGALGAALAGFDATAVAAGQFGFNPALTALTLSLIFRRAWPFIAAGILTSIVLELALTALDTRLFTAPFILSVWLFAGRSRGRSS